MPPGAVPAVDRLREGSGLVGDDEVRAQFEDALHLLERDGAATGLAGAVDDEKVAVIDIFRQRRAQPGRVARRLQCLIGHDHAEIGIVEHPAIRRRRDPRHIDDDGVMLPEQHRNRRLDRLLGDVEVFAQ